MNYIAQLYFKIDIENQKMAQFDCQLRLVKAENEEEAYFIAKEIGLKEENHFINEHGKLVKWNFAGITQINELKTEESGSQLFSTTIETDLKDSFHQYILAKSKDLALELSKKELTFSL